jgi:hypothetical protein
MYPPINRGHSSAAQQFFQRVFEYLCDERFLAGQRFGYGKTFVPPTAFDQETRKLEADAPRSGQPQPGDEKVRKQRVKRDVLWCWQGEQARAFCRREERVCVRPYQPASQRSVVRPGQRNDLKSTLDIR